MTTANKNIEELIKEAQSGNETAMNELLQSFKPLLITNSYVDGKLNEDCLQELSIEFIKSVRRFKFSE